MIIFLILAFLTACLEISFHAYMDENMVLRPYRSLLKKLYYSGKFGAWLSLPLGLCKYCHGFWLAVIVYLIYYRHLSLMIFLFTGFNYVCIKVIELINNK
jgi:hypothetical protein